MRPLLIPLLALALALAGPLRADEPFETVRGMVVDVTDGDTVRVRVEGRIEKVRLYGIDCPEKKQKFGRDATLFTASRVMGREVTLERRGVDHYGRTIAVIHAGGPTSLNEEIVKEGFAWWLTSKAPRDIALQMAEWDARNARRGLWAQNAPVPPWTWRRTAGAR